MSWVRVIYNRIKSDFKYLAYVYNNFHGHNQQKRKHSEFTTLTLSGTVLGSVIYNVAVSRF